MLDILSSFREEKSKHEFFKRPIDIKKKYDPKNRFNYGKQSIGSLI